MNLGVRPATDWVRRVVCYCHPERCKAAALRKAKAAARERAADERLPLHPTDGPRK